MKKLLLTLVLLIVAVASFEQTRVFFLFQSLRFIGNTQFGINLALRIKDSPTAMNLALNDVDALGGAMHFNSYMMLKETTNKKELIGKLEELVAMSDISLSKKSAMYSLLWEHTSDPKWLCPWYEILKQPGCKFNTHMRRHMRGVFLDCDSEYAKISDEEFIDWRKPLTLTTEEFKKMVYFHYNSNGGDWKRIGE
ncbi:MAG: hypothetical protein A2283_11490 [Lentisphaerae bacterium RIFOXYA12_FULL_48_11]|nr:MAG: hypothetical protein A2283_11490 [Lentisphaerae bacterium RIFOXYA12_FULL_48_11]